MSYSNYIRLLVNESTKRPIILKELSELIKSYKHKLSEAEVVTYRTIMNSNNYDNSHLELIILKLEERILTEL
jgi:hypothetical protein